MNKALIGGIAGLLILGGAAAGGSRYADKQLTANVYSPELMQRSFGLLGFQAQTDMGVFSGSAEWQGNLVFDPCRPEQKITIRGNDTIRRSLSGYQVDSKIYFVTDSAEANELLFEGFHIDVRRSISWGGKVKTEFTIPGRNIQKNGTVLNWQSISGQSSLHKENDELVPDSLQFSVPSVEIKSNLADITLKDLRYRNKHSFLGHGSVQTGGSETTVASIAVNSPGSGSVVLSGLKAASRQTVNGQSVGWGSRFDIRNIDITVLAPPTLAEGGTPLPARIVKHTIGDVRLNTDIAGLDSKAVQSVSDLLAQQRRTCMPKEELKARLEKIFLAVLNGGFNIKAAGQRIKFDGHLLAADAELTLPPAASTDVREIKSEALLGNMKYRADIRIDKGLITACNRAVADWLGGGYDKADAKSQQVIEQLLALPGARQEGNAIRLTFKQP